MKTVKFKSEKMAALTKRAVKFLDELKEENLSVYEIVAIGFILQDMFMKLNSELGVELKAKK